MVFPRVHGLGYSTQNDYLGRLEIAAINHGQLARLQLYKGTLMGCLSAILKEATALNSAVI